MARFSCDGLDDLMDQLTAAGELLNGEVADKMLMAGAEAVKTAWKNAVKTHHHIKMGYLLESIDYAKAPSDVGGVRSIDIYPQGVDPDTGVRNAEKAFVKHYGTSKNPGSHWVDTADKECDSTVIPAMAAVFDAEMAQKGL